MTTSLDAARWLADLRWEDLPADVQADAKLRLLDTIGLMMRATASPIGRAVRAGANAMGGGVEARMIGFGDRTAAMLAGLVNGTLAHAADFDDTHNPSVMHPSAPTVATALALVDRARPGGRDLLALVAGGIELNCRLAMVSPGNLLKVGYHPTGVVGALVAPMIAGRLLRLDAKTTAAAVGIAASQASGVLEAYADGTWSKTLHPGWAAHAGIAAARLAEAGFTGPATGIEGRFGVFRTHVQDPAAGFDFALVTRDLGSHWHLRENSFKPYPCAHAIHPYIDAALDLHAGGLRAEQVVQVVLPLAPYLKSVIAEPRALKLAPQTPTHARASLPFCTAVALLHGRFGEDLLSAEAIADPRLRDLAARILCEDDPDPPPKTQFRGGALATLADGSRREARQPHNRGSRENPMTRAELDAKFIEGALAVVDRARADRIIAAIDGLDRSADAATLIDLCVP